MSAVMVTVHDTGWTFEWEHPEDGPQFYYTRDESAARRMADRLAVVLPKQATGVCSFGDCDGSIIAKGLCWGHYQQQRRHLPLRPLQPRQRDERRAFGDCSFDGCDRPSKSMNLCNAHYQQQWQGKPLTPIRSYRKNTEDKA